MLIAWLEPPSVATQGDQIHRTLWPARTLAGQGPEHFIVGSWLSPTMRTAADIADGLILCQAFDVDLLRLLERRRARGLWTIVEINDQIYNDTAVGEAGSFYQQAETQALVEQIAQLADGLWCTSEPLRAQHSRAGQPAAVLVNAAPDARPARPVRRPGAPFRVGWAGSAGHYEDIRSVVPTLAAWLRASPEASLHIMAPRSVWQALDGLPREQVVIVRDAPFPQYLDFLSNLDVSLAPLLDTPFNRARSDVKFLEAAAMGAVFVGQQAAAYQKSVRDGVNARTFAHPDALPSILHALADAPEGCVKLSQAAREQLKDTRSIDALAQARRAFWQKLGHKQARTQQRRDTSSRWQQLVQKARREVGSAIELSERFCRLPIAGAQYDLFVGLLRGQNGRDAVRRARLAQPSFYLPPLAEALATTQPEQASLLLDQASALAPNSDAVALARARFSLQRGDSQQALHLTRQATQRGSLHGPLWEQQARLLLMQHDQAAAESLLRQALKHTPFLRSARELLCHLLCQPSAQRAERLHEAMTIAKEGSRLMPKHSAPRLSVARVLRAHGAWSDVVSEAQAALGLTSSASALRFEGHALCAEAYVKLGQPHAARRHLALAQAR